MRVNSIPKAIKLTPNANQSYKLGLDEIEGLGQAMRLAFKPIEELIRQDAYWERDKATGGAK